MSLINQHILALAITVVTTLGLAIFVAFQPIRKGIKWTFVLYSLSITLWSAGQAYALYEPNMTLSLISVRFCHIGVILIPVFFVHFLMNLLEKTKDARKIVYLIYGVGLFFLIFVPTRGIVKDVTLHPPNFRYVYNPGYLYPLLIVFWFLSVCYGLYLLFTEFVKSSELKRNQLKYLFIGTLLGYLGGVSNFLFAYDIHIKIYMPLGTYAIPFYIGIFAYAITRYQLMDIEVVIKKTLVYAGLFTFAFGVIVGVAMLTQELVSQFFAINRFVSLAISAIIIIFSLRPLENFLVNATNKYLFQKKYDPRKILKEFADEVLTILNLDRLCRVTIDTLIEHLYLTNCVVLLLGREEFGYEIYDSFGIEDKNTYFNTESDLIKSLEANHLPLLYQSYDKLLQAQDAVKENMDKIQSQLCMPLIIHNELVGILSLGTKKSDQPYNADDIDILTTLTKALSIAISNARLFMQAAQNEKLAAIGTITSAINHEIGGPLSRISAQIQMYMENKKRKVFEDEALKENLEKTEKIMLNTMNEIKKVTDIASKLSGFAKPSKIVESKPIDISQSISDALDLLRHKFQLDRIKVEKNIPTDLSKIIVDEDQMQQVFFNLIKNAAEAIKEDGTITITAKEDGNNVKIAIIDTGCGIPEDKLDKIFQSFYTTKGGTKGSGLGLVVVRELIQRNNGNISVESKVGEGTTFYLEFPKA